MNIGEVRPGDGAMGSPEAAAVPIESPLVRLGLGFGDALHQAAEDRAPGIASVPWKEWPENPIGDSPLPTLLRIGSIGEDCLPVLVPVLGEAHLALGNPWLVTPIVIRPVLTTLNQLEANRIKMEAATDEQNQNEHRLADLAREREIAIRAACGLMTRTIGSMAPGSVNLTVYDPVDQGAAFSAFSRLSQRGLYNVAGPGELPGLLDELDRQIMHTYSQVLGGFPTMRSLIDQSGARPPVPWRMVALISNGEILTREENEKLARIVRNGVACGISLLIHGLQTAPHDDIRTIQLTLDGRARSDAVGPVSFRLDDAPPVSVMSSTAWAAAQHRQYASVEANVGSEQIPSPEEAAARLPGPGYTKMLNRRLSEYRRAAGRINNFNDQHPYLDPTFLRENILPSASPPDLNPYLWFAAEAATQRGMATARIRKAMGRNRADPLEQMQAWAALDLLRAAPGHGPELASVVYGLAAQRNIDRHLKNLADVVAFTRRHGVDRLPTFTRDYTAQYLPNDPPAWAFQIVADAATRRRGSRPEAVDAIYFDLEQTFDCMLRDKEGRVVNRDLTNCLVECRLLQLYYFAATPVALRTLLARRAQPRLERVDRELIPPAALFVYDHCKSYLDQLDEPPQRPEDVVGAIGTTAVGPQPGAWAPPR